MIILSQRDPRWVETKIGASNLSVGRWGCTLTSCSMLSDYFKGFLSPAQIASRKDWFTPEGLVLWSKLNFPTMKFVKRFYGRDDVGIKDALKDPNKAVILEVANRSHWVVGVSPTWFGNSYNGIDPFFGDKCDIIKRYKNITGGAYFARK